MDLSRRSTTWGSLGLVLVSTLCIDVVVVLYTRLAGARSLATMSSFDFAATVAIGSTVATAANLGTPLVHGVFSLAVLYLAQLLAAGLRRRRALGSAMDNDPLLVYADGEILDQHLRAGHIAETEVWSAVRRAGITRIDEIEGRVAVKPAIRPARRPSPPPSPARAGGPGGPPS